jgi:tetratricopeptide (TPR) repeat protein
MIDKQAIDNLLEQAYNCIQEGRVDAAIAVGNELLKLQHARGFEIIALAYEQQGRVPEAISILREGVAKVPQAWPLWELLGNIYSDQEDYGEAHECYNQALACPKADTDSIRYNITILLKRQNKLSDALKLCDHIKGEELGIKLPVLRIAILNALRRYDEAAKLARGLLEKITSLPDLAEEEMPEIARAHAELARALWEGSKDKQAAWENAWKALEWDRCENSALWLVREIIGRKSPASKWFKLVIEGQWHHSLEQNKPAPGFIMTYEVVADSPEDALRFARDLEPLDIRNGMKVESYDDLGSFPDNTQGVYWRSAYGFYS